MYQVLNDTSQEAADSIDVTALEAMVTSVIAQFGPQGCISDQVRQKLPGLAYSSVTARYRALLDKGVIVDTGMRRPGRSGRNQRVMRLGGCGMKFDRIARIFGLPIPKSGFSEGIARQGRAW